MTVRTRSRIDHARWMPRAPEPGRPSGIGHAGTDNVVGADPVGDAFGAWMRTCTRAGWIGDLGSETTAVTAAHGRVTATAIRARWPVPAYRAAAMDGIAVTTATVTTAKGAGQAGTMTVSGEDFDRVDTGDPVPEGRDAVVMREQVTFVANGTAQIAGQVIVGQHIRQVGEDMAAGVIVLPAGHRVRPVDAAAVAAAGHASIAVRRRPKVAILPTGNEIRPVGTALSPGEILDTNSIMLTGWLEEAGCTPETLPIAPDDPEHIAATVVAAAREADLVLIIAGSSAGRDDHTSSIIGQLGRVAVHGVAMRPGHPVVLGVLGGIDDSAAKSESSVGEAGSRSDWLALPARPGAPPVPVVGIPGYPASAERSFSCFVRPLLRRMLDTAGARSVEHGVSARLAEPITSAEHLDEYVRVRLTQVLAPRTGSLDLVAVVLPRGASALNTLVQTEAILRVPAGITGYPAGSTVRPVPVPGAAFAAGTTIVNGARSSVADALTEVLGSDLPLSAVHWRTCTESAAIDALADGLCHAAAIAIDVTGGRLDDLTVGSLVDRVGPILLLELARVGARADVLVVPAAAGDHPAIQELRTAVRSIAFRRALRDIPGCSGHGAGHETWHGSAESRAKSVLAISVARGTVSSIEMIQCATR